MYSWSNLERGENGRTFLTKQAKNPQWHFYRCSRQGKCGHFILTQIKINKHFHSCLEEKIYTFAAIKDVQGREGCLFYKCETMFSSDKKKKKNSIRFSFPVTHCSGHGTAVIYPSLPFGNIWVTKASVNNRITNLPHTGPILCKISGWFPTEMSNYTACGWVHTTGYLLFRFTPPPLFSSPGNFHQMCQQGSCIQGCRNPHTLFKWMTKERNTNDGLTETAKKPTSPLIRHQRLYTTEDKQAYLHPWQNN